MSNDKKDACAQNQLRLKFLTHVMKKMQQKCDSKEECCEHMNSYKIKKGTCA